MTVSKESFENDLFNVLYGPSSGDLSLRPLLSEHSTEEAVDKFIREHPELINLQRAYIMDTEFSEKYYKLTTLCPKLSQVTLYRWDRSSNFKPIVEWIQQCESIKSLQLWIPEGCWSHFVGLTQITELGIDQWTASSKEAYLDLVNSMPNLTSLICKPRGNLDCLTLIPFPHQIKILRLDNTWDITCSRVALNLFSELEVLSLAKSSPKAVSDEILQSLELLNLQSLNLAYNSQLTSKGILSLKRFEHLTALNLSFCENVEDEALSMLLQSVQFLFLSLHGCPKITDSGLSNLAFQKKLLALTFGGSEKIHDISFMRFLSELRVLHIEGSQLDEAKESLPMLVHLKKLVLLAILNAPKVNDGALKALSGMTHLINFQFQGTGVTSKGAEIVDSLTKKEVEWI